jgi:hypothetical protein
VYYISLYEAICHWRFILFALYNTTMTHYSFTTSFRIYSSVEEVWKTLLDYPHWKTWWKGVRQMRVETNKTGQLLHVSIGYPFYSLKLKLQVTNVELGKVGLFLLHGDANKTNVTFDWNVSTPKPWMNAVAKVAKPLFEFSHNLVMKWFVHGLAKQLHTITKHEQYMINNAVPSRQTISVS